METYDLINSPIVDLFYRDKKYFFKILDQAHNPIIISSPYNNKKQREEALNFLVMNVESLETYKAGKKTWFSIPNPSSQGDDFQSVKFSTVEEMEDGIRFLKKQFTGRQDKDEKIKPLKDKKLENPEPVKQEFPQRLSFHLQFYISDDGENLRGKIEYPLTKEKASFDGFDEVKIKQFIEGFLPRQEEILKEIPEDRQETPAPITPEPEKLQPLITADKEVSVGVPALSSEEALQFHFSDLHDNILDYTTFHKTDQVCIKLSLEEHLPKLLSHSETERIQTQIYARFLETNDRYLIAANNDDISLKTKSITFPLNVYALQIGVSRLEIITKIKPAIHGYNASVPDNSVQLFAKTLIQVC